MTLPHRDLTALLGSRICHDLISPLGAIGNGVELLGMTGAASGPEIDLISESVGNANARIRFFRIAFGYGTSGQEIGRSEVRGIISDLTRGTRLNIDWRIETDQPRADVKLGFLLLLCFESSMPFGGKITVSNMGDTWEISGTADKLKVNPDLWAVAGDPSVEAEVTPANVHFALVPESLMDRGRRLFTDITDTGITVRF